MQKFIVFVLTAVIVVGSAADVMAATKKKTTANTAKLSNWDRCQLVCRASYGNTANVYRVVMKSGRPFCWCRM